MQPSVDCPALREAFSANPWLSNDDSSILALAAELNLTRTQLINYWTRNRLRRLKIGKQKRPRKAPKDDEQSYKPNPKTHERALGVVVKTGKRVHTSTTLEEPITSQVQDVNAESDNDSLTDIEELEEYLGKGEEDEDKSTMFDKHDEMDPDKTLIDEIVDSGMESSPDEPLCKRVRFSLPEDGKAQFQTSPAPSTSSRTVSPSNAKTDHSPQQGLTHAQCSTSPCPKDAQVSPHKDVVDPDTEMLTMSDCEPVSMSELDELLRSPPKKRSLKFVDARDESQNANLSVQHSSLPHLKSFSAVVEYGPSKAVPQPEITSIDQNLGRSAPSSSSSSSSEQHSRSFMTPEDEKYWIDCALGLRKLDASDPPFSALSKEMQNYIREQCGPPKPKETAVPLAVAGAAHAVHAPEQSGSMQSAMNVKTEPSKPIPAFMPLALARHASKESITASSSHPPSPPSSTASSNASTSSHSSSSRSTPANSSSEATSATTRARTKTLGSPIKLYCETPSRNRHYRPAASRKTAPSYFWDFTSPSRPFVYDFDLTYETNSKEPSFGYMSTSATSTRESSVESMNMSTSEAEVEEEKSWMMAIDDEEMSPMKVKGGTGLPVVVIDEDDDGYTWELNASPSTKAHGLKLPNFHLIPPTPF